MVITVAFIIAPAVISLFGIDHSKYNSGERVFGTWFASLVGYSLTFLVVSMITGEYQYKEVDYSSCQFAQTDTKTFVECTGGVEVSTDAHYIYENYGDSTKVGVYEIIPESDTGMSLLIEKTKILPKNEVNE